MRSCMERALQDLAAAEEPFTYLMPARKEYYEPFQFVMLTEERRLIQGDEAFVKPGRERVRSFQSFPARDASYMDQLRAEVQCEGGDLLEWDDGNSYCAYVLNRKSEPPGIVIEQIFEAEYSRDDRARASGRERNMQTDVWQDRIIPELYRRYGNAEIEYIESQPMMLRILDAEQFVTLLPYDGRQKRMNICLTDPICEKNNGSFRLVLSPEGCRLLRGEPEKDTEFRKSAVRWDIRQLTTFLLQKTRLGEKLYLMEIV